MTKPDPKDGTILNFNSPEEQEAVEVVFNNAITPLAEAGLFMPMRTVCSYWAVTLATVCRKHHMSIDNPC